jgi:hypothetical protein
MPDWPTQVADTIEHAVGVVRDKTVVPAQRATKAVVFGLLATFFLGTAFTLAVIGGFRGLVVLTGDVWMAYLIVGGIFILAGTFCWTRRTKRPPKDDASKDDKQD